MDQNTKDVLMIVIPSVTAIGTAYVAVLASRTARDVLRVEKATNSHTDLLVAATQRAAHAQGKEEGRVEEIARQETK